MAASGAPATRESAAVLGIDLGTSGVKVVVLGLDGVVRGAATRGYEVIAAAPGHAETAPAVWWEAVGGAVAEALRAASGPEVVAVGVDGQMHGLVMADAAGVPVRPALLWADGRAAQESRRWAGLDQSLVRSLGNPVTPGMTGPLWRWVATHEPDVLARARWVLLPKDWLHAALTGVIGTEPSDASATLLWDVAEDRWAMPVLAAVGLDPGLLPPLRPSVAAEPLTARAADHLGLPPGVPVTAGCADTAAGLLATGLSAGTGPSAVQITVGSGAQVVRPLARPVIAEGPVTHVYRTAEPSGWYALGAVQNAGLALGRVRAWLGARWDEVYGALSRSAPGAAGVTFLPYLTGERTPLLAADVRGAWEGLSLACSRDDLLRAALEGVAFAVAEALAALPGPAPGSALLLGGGARDAGFRQLLADVCGVRMVWLPEAGGSAVGAALLAARAAGLEEPPRRGRREAVEPSDRRAAYDAPRARFAAHSARAVEAAGSGGP